MQGRQLIGALYTLGPTFLRVPLFVLINRPSLLVRRISNGMPIGMQLVTKSKSVATAPAFCVHWLSLYVTLYCCCTLSAAVVPVETLMTVRQTPLHCLASRCKRSVLFVTCVAVLLATVHATMSAMRSLLKSLDSLETGDDDHDSQMYMERWPQHMAGLSRCLSSPANPTVRGQNY